MRPKSPVFDKTLLLAGCIGNHDRQILAASCLTRTLRCGLAVATRRAMPEACSTDAARRPCNGHRPHIPQRFRHTGKAFCAEREP